MRNQRWYWLRRLWPFRCHGAVVDDDRLPWPLVCPVCYGEAVTSQPEQTSGTPSRTGRLLHTCARCHVTWRTGQKDMP